MDRQFQCGARGIARRATLGMGACLALAPRLALAQADPAPEARSGLADRIGVIAHGRLIAEGTLDELRRRTGKTATSLEDTFLTLVAEPVAAE